MNLLLIDRQSFLSDDHARKARNRLYFSLARFECWINGVTLHISKDEMDHEITCTINVNLEGTGIITVSHQGPSIQRALNSAVDAMESRVACRVDWRGRFNAETAATWITSLTGPIQRVVGLVTRRDQPGCHVNKSTQPQNFAPFQDNATNSLLN